MKSNEQAIVNLVINGEQGKTTLREVTGAYNAMRSEISKMRKEDDPKAYAEKIELLKKLKASQKSMNEEIYSSGESSKKFSEDFKGAIGEATGKLGPAGGMLSTFFGFFTTGKAQITAAMGTLSAYTAAVNTARAAQIAATEANVLAKEAELALAAGTGTAAAAETAKTAAIIAGTVASEAAVEASKILKVAMASTGIGLVVVALGALVTYFTQTNEGAKTLKIVFGALHSLFQAGVKLIASFGGGIVDAVTHPIEGLKKLGAMIQENVINRFKAFAVIYQAIKSGDFKGALNGVLQLGTGITDVTGKLAGMGKSIVAVAKEGANMAEDRIKLTVAERNWSTEKIKQQKEVDLLTMKIRQQTLSESARIAMAEKAKVLKNEIFKKDKEFADKNLELVNREQAAMSKKDKQAIADAKNRVETLDAEHATSTQNIDNRESKLLKKQQSAQESAAEKQKKDAEELAKLQSDATNAKLASIAREAQTVMDSYGKELSAADEYYRDLIVKQEQNAIKFPKQKAIFDEQIVQLEKEKNAKLAELSDTFRKEDSAKVEKIQKELVQLSMDGINDREQHDRAILKIATDEKLKAFDKEAKDTQGIIDKQVAEIITLRSKGKTEEAKVLEQSVSREMDILDTSGKLRAAFIKSQAEKEAQIKRDAANKKSITIADTEVVQATDPKSKLQADLDLLNAKHDAEISNEKLTADEKNLINAQYQKDKKALEDDYSKQAVDFAIQTAEQITSTAFTIMAQTRQADSDARVADINKNRDAELANKNLTESQKKAINDKYDKQLQAEKIRAFKANQLASIEQAIINGALAVTMALAQTGVLAGFVIPGIIAATAAQVTLIAAQKPPKAKKGMIIPRGPSHEQGGMNITNNQTGEVVAEMEGNEPVLILRKDLPEANLAMIKRLAFENTFGNSSAVDNTSVSAGLQMARLGALYTPSSSSSSAAPDTASYQSNSTQPNSMESLFRELITATREEKSRPVDFNYRLLEQFKDRVENIKNEVNS